MAEGAARSDDIFESSRSVAEADAHRSQSLTCGKGNLGKFQPEPTLVGALETLKKSDLDETVGLRRVAMGLGIGLFVAAGLVHRFEKPPEVAPRTEKTGEVATRPTQSAAEWEAEQRRKREQEKADEQALAEVQAQINAQEELRCAKDLDCIAEKMADEADLQCSPAIESLAKYDFQWTTEGLFERHLDHILRTSKLPVITYLGERIKFQNGFGAWLVGSYECDFNVQTGRALAVRAQTGHLGPGERVSAGGTANRGGGNSTVRRGGN